MVAKNVADDTKCHVDDILCLDMSADRKLVVTGQVGKAPVLFVWDAETCEVKCRIKLAEGGRGIAACAISPCQRYVVAVDMHNDHHVVIHNIKKNKTLLTIEGSKDTIVHCAWSKKPEDLRFCVVGLKEVKFWHPADSSKRLSVKGTFGNREMTSFTCVDFDTEGMAYTAG